MATSGRPLPPDVRNEILHLLNNRLSIRKIARRCGVCLATVQKLKKRLESPTVARTSNLP